MIGFLLCLIGHHDWSCDNSHRCMGMGEHYCRRCLKGIPEILAAIR